ncbi:MAG: hypothetical protein M9939_26585 [Mesorhizobium sp.]|nr:hypothetical protein [Mesorhizobium sp.]MCO5164661.1 hypothetical protein [Mesorhizobium sp.]
MAALNQLSIIDAPGQVFSTVVDGRKVTIRLRYNVQAERFAMDLAIDETDVLKGRKVVAEIDLLAPFDFGIGSIFAADVDRKWRPPTLANFVNGAVKLFHYI